MIVIIITKYEIMEKIKLFINEQMYFFYNNFFQIASSFTREIMAMPNGGPMADQIQLPLLQLL